MRRYTPIIALAAIALLLMGASSCSNSKTSSGTVYAGGTNGLLLSFENDAPPSTIYDNSQSPFSIILDVKNDGEFDTQNIHFWVTGINSNDFPGLPQTTDYTTQPIQGVTKLQDQTIPGATVPIPIGPSNICYQNSLKGGGQLDFKLNVNACYGYATQSTSQVCLKGNYLNGDNSVCDPQSTTQFSVSGAPVTITSFKQQAVGQHQLRLQWTYALKNNVDIWAPYPGQTCDPQSQTQRILEQNWMYIRLDDNQGTSGAIRCMNLLNESSAQHPQNVVYNGPALLAYKQQYLSGNAIAVNKIVKSTDGYLKLGPDGTATLTCTLDVPQNTQDSTSTVSMVATYMVHDSVSKIITVSHSDGASGAAQCASGTTGGSTNTPPPGYNQGGPGLPQNTGGSTGGSCPYSNGAHCPEILSACSGSSASCCQQALIGHCTTTA